MRVFFPGSAPTRIEAAVADHEPSMPVLRVIVRERDQQGFVTERAIDCRPGEAIVTDQPLEIVRPLRPATEEAPTSGWKFGEVAQVVRRADFVAGSVYSHTLYAY